MTDKLDRQLFDTEMQNTIQSRERTDCNSPVLLAAAQQHQSGYLIARSHTHDIYELFTSFCYDWKEKNSFFFFFYNFYI
jgi:hypothetical protein